MLNTHKTAAEATREEFIGIRIPVRRFAIGMDWKLKQNDHKGGWENSNPFDLLLRLYEEVNELQLAMKAWVEGEKVGADVVEEAYDVGNFAMFIADIAHHNTFWKDVPYVKSS